MFLLQYIRLAPDNLDKEHVKELLLKDWKLSIPDVLISVMGDNEVTQTNPELAGLVSNVLTQVSIL